jgi:hypothetical protein
MKSASMASVNEIGDVILLRQFMDDDQGWGREAGRVVYQRLLEHVEDSPGIAVFRLSLTGVRRLDISFASETIIELARRYRGAKGFCFTDLTDVDLIENVEAAAAKRAQPLIIWLGDVARVIGAEPSQGNREALTFALARPMVRAAEFSQATRDMSIANASTKFKQLWEQGFLLRREATAESGGVEFVYYRIR